MLAAGALVAAALVAGVGCTRAPPASAMPGSSSEIDPHRDELAALRDFENGTRARTDFAHGSTSDTALGPDPYVVRAYASRLPRSSGGGPAFVGLLRGRSVLVELDASLAETARLPAPPSPTGLAIAPSGDVLVVGEQTGRIARYRADPRAGGKLAPAGSIELAGVRGLRDVATGPEGVVYAVEEHDGRLLTLVPSAEPIPSAPVARADLPLCHGPVHVVRVDAALLVDCLLDHTVVVRAVDAHGFPLGEEQARITQDGPMWGIDAVRDARGLLIAVGGVEDHPLDRTEGSFGFVDSFVTLYRVAGGEVRRLSAVNTSALGVVTPKALSLSHQKEGGIELAVAAYGSGRMARMAWPLGPDDEARPPGEPAVTTRAVPPGAASLERLPDGSLVMASPLLDAWIRVAPAPSTAVDVVPANDEGPDPPRSPESRLGEALFFTTLMAPWQKSDGRLSRFTCETCHFEGYVDGRTHHTGRADVRATTKPLVGLFNNRPHFSRALDPDLTTMVNNEFRVAGAKSDHDPWFALSPADVPWLHELAVPDVPVAPAALRRALMAFFMDFTHRPNPSVAGRSHWTDVERAGAVVFRDKCESCHAARLVADDAGTRVPFEQWEQRVFSPQGPIVWGRAEYAKTGVVPYVNERGARVVSLRRLYKKYPYFTNGSAKDVASVLSRARILADGTFLHDPGGAPDAAGAALGEDEQAQLAAFLDLL